LLSAWTAAVTTFVEQHENDDIPKSTQEKNDERIRDCCICQGEEFCKPLYPSTSKWRGRVWCKSEFVVKARSYRPAQMRENAKNSVAEDSAMVVVEFETFV
jgi:hypothetical protein